MRIYKLTLILIAFLVTSNCYAVEPTLEPHAMLYFEIPLGSSFKDHAKPAFGFRMDTALVEPGKPINYSKLFSHQAILDLKMGRSGIEELNISGVDFLKQIRTLHANGDDAGTTNEDEAGAATGDAGAGDSAATGEGETATAEKKGGLLNNLPDYSGAIKKSQYLGLVLGAVIGVAVVIGPLN